MNDKDLENITGGATSDSPLSKYPIGTEVLEDAFSQAEGEVKHSEEEGKRFRRCRKLTFK